MNLKSILVVPLFMLLWAPSQAQSCQGCSNAFQTCFSWRIISLLEGGVSAQDFQIAIDSCLPDFKDCTYNSCSKKSCKDEVRDIKKFVQEMLKANDFKKGRRLVMRRVRKAARTYCRANRKECIASCKAGKAAELARCTTLRGRSKRKCRRSARRGKRDCKRSCSR